MRLKDAWAPVDQLAGTPINTFVYGVARDDGLFYPTKVSMPFGDDVKEFGNYEWRAHNAIKSLQADGHDLPQVLIDRAHHHGMDFIASLRLGG
ncbi:MAG: hypothetical protein FJ319_04880 [SAR202 cluster bacterium]|nr:hypothetical protein [SAR202 cluster bacterium]